MRRDRGLILVNALVIVLAIAAVSVAMLSLAAKGRARIGTTVSTNQLVLYLDGIQILIPLLLEREWERNGNDHLGEFWATQGYSVPIDRGIAEARLTDQQGLLDVNRLVAPDETTRQEFARLFDTLGLSPRLLEAMIDFLSENGPGHVTPYLDRPVPLLPGGGRIALIGELRQVEGFDDAGFARLAPYVSALPELLPLNANTAPPEVLGAVLPGLQGDQIALLVRARERAPFASRVDFLIRAEQLLGAGSMSGTPPERFGVQSTYFAAALRAGLDGRFLDRMVLYRRSNADKGRTVAVYSHAVTPTDAGL